VFQIASFWLSFTAMSAVEIIEQIKALPREERQRVAEFVRNADLDESTDQPSVRYADDTAFEAALDRTFEKHDELFKKLAQ
jgi:hypothetical protein